jgi:hypothetical protein
MINLRCKIRSFVYGSRDIGWYMLSKDGHWRSIHYGISPETGKVCGRSYTR